MAKPLRSLWRFFQFTSIVGAISVIALILYLDSKLPSVDTLKDVKLQVPLKIYSNDGKLIAEYGEKRRTPLQIEQIPQTLIHAVLATEDRRFYTHPGVDLRGLMRAAISLLTKGTKEQGGSTITMQVARNFFLTRKKTYTRKLNEILLAFKVEKTLNKDEILELYFNKIYLGKRAYGVAAAAEVYYGTTVDKLTLAQIAMIAGLPQAPSAINPLYDPTAALKRRKHVLNRMLHYGFITEQQHTEAYDAPITAKYHGRPIELHAPYVAEMVRQALIEQFGEEAYEQGMEAYTTIDSKLQTAANFALQQTIHEYDERHGYRKPITRFLFTQNHSAEQDLLAWQQQLQAIPSFGKLQPAVVTNIEQDKIWLITQDKTALALPWKQMQWARKQLSNHKLGPKPKVPADIVELGDVIYLRKEKADWKLAQEPEVEGALISMDPNSGKILALVGGYDFSKSPFNRVTQADRQPGSSFKPFVYGAALENGFTAASVINDAPIVQQDAIGEYDWRPQNSTRKFYGPTRLRVGMTRSRNLVSIRLLKAIGIDKSIEYISRFGFNPDTLPRGLSLALGASIVSPLEMNTAYCTYANGGYKVNSAFLDRIEDAYGNILYKNSYSTICRNGDCADETQYAPQVVTNQIAYLMTSLLQDSIQSTTRNRGISLGRRDLAGKTGSTNDFMDAWYAGYNADLATTVWLGYDNPKSLKEYAVKAALPMWVYFMKEALKDQPEHSPSQPAGLVTVRIDPTTGLLARSGQPDAIYEIFLENSVPKEIAPSRHTNSSNQLLDPNDGDSLF